MARARRLAPVAVLALACVAPATAAAKLEFNLPSQVFLEQDKSFVSQNDPNRCQVAAFAEFPMIKHAVSYEIVVKRTDQNNQTTQYVAPPFETTGFTARYPPPPGFGRFFLGAYSTGDGCAAAIANVEGKAVIVSSKVSLDRAFEKRFHKIDKPPYKCELPRPKRVVKLKGWLSDPRLIIVRRQGTVTTTEPQTNQPVNVFTNRYATAGTTVTTGHNSAVQIATLDGRSVLVGPDMTVRLTPTGFEVLKQPAKRARFTVLPRPGQHPVRTDCPILSARG